MTGWGNRDADIAHPCHTRPHQREGDGMVIRRVAGSTYFFGALGGLLFGYDLGIVAGALLFLKPQLRLSSWQTGAITSSLLVGAMLGALVCGWITDRFGRRAVVLGSAVLFGLGAVGAGLAPGFTVIVVFRLVMGVAVGAASATVPVYLSEIAPARIRGSLSGLNQLMISIGILVAYLVSLALSAEHGWRWMFGLGAVPALLLLIGGYFQPESPRWLVRKGREAEARAVLAGSRSPDELEAELREIARVNEDQRHNAGLRELLGNRRLRRILFIGIGLAVLQQIIGINTIVYYAPTILNSIGFAASAAILTNAGLGALTVVVTVVLLLVVDRVGRRRPLIYGAVGMAVSMALLGTLFSVAGLTRGVVGWVAILALAAFKVCYSLSWGGLVWIMLGELFPLRARGMAMGVATCANWLGNFLVGFLFPVLLEVGSGLVFLIFAVLCVLAFLFALFVVPETRRASLEQIEERLGLSAGVARPESAY
jgi:sugar porter (SP) family MFS transporter